MAAQAPIDINMKLNTETLKVNIEPSQQIHSHIYSYPSFNSVYSPGIINIRMGGATTQVSAKQTPKKGK